MFSSKANGDFCRGGNQYKWSSPQCISTLTIAGVGIVSLVIYETFFRKDGIFHHGLFANRNAPIAVCSIFIEGVVYITLNIFLVRLVNASLAAR